MWKVLWPGSPHWKYALCTTVAKCNSSQFVVLGCALWDTCQMTLCRTHVWDTCLCNMMAATRHSKLFNTHHKANEFLKLHDGTHCIEHVLFCMACLLYVHMSFAWYVFCTSIGLGPSRASLLCVCVFTCIPCLSTLPHHQLCPSHFTISLLLVHSEALSW